MHKNCQNEELYALEIGYSNVKEKKTPRVEKKII